MSGAPLKYEDVKFVDINDEGAVGAVLGSKGKYYVFGVINQFGGKEDLDQFTVVRTNTVDT